MGSFTIGAAVPASGEKSIAASIAELIATYEANRYNNNRVSSVIPSALITFGGTPAANTVGYANSGVSTSGYNMKAWCPSGATGAPNSAGKKARPPFRLNGAMPYDEFGKVTGAYSLAGSRTQQGTARLVFVTDEPKPIINCIGYSSIYALNINDGTGWRSILDSSIAPGPNKVLRPGFLSPSPGGFGNVQLDLTTVGGRKPRIFELLMYGDAAVQQIGIRAASTWFDPPPTKQIAAFTDSLGASVSDGNMMDAYPNLVMDIAGWRDLWLFADGGSGFISTNGGTVRTHLQKIQNAQLITQLDNVGLVYLQASVNDSSYPTAQITAAAVDAINSALAAWPNAVVVVGGPTAGNTLSNQTTMIAVDNAVAAAVAQVASSRALYFPTMADPNGQAISGTGNAQSPTGNGNADVYFNNTDGTHFNGVGHGLWGQGRALPGIVGQMRAYLTAAK